MANAEGETARRTAINASGFAKFMSLAVERDLCLVLFGVGLNMVSSLWFWVNRQWMLGSSTNQGWLGTKVSFHTRNEHFGPGTFPGQRSHHHPFSELVSVVEPGRYPVPTQNNIAHH
jgi:hypothetical protein